MTIYRFAAVAALALLGAGCSPLKNYDGPENAALCISSDIMLSDDSKYGIKAGRYNYISGDWSETIYSVSADDGLSKKGGSYRLTGATVRWSPTPYICVSSENHRNFCATIKNIRKDPLIYRCQKKSTHAAQQ